MCLREHDEWVDMDSLVSLGLDTQLAALADPKRLSILRLLMASRMRQVDIGQAIGKHPAWVHHHLLQLIKAGLVELVEERKVANYTEKWYRATSSAYAVHLLVTPETVTVQLTTLERIEAIHADVTVPRSSVVSVRAVPDAMKEVHGIRAPGTGVPGLVMIGTLRDHGVTTFAVCHGHHRAVLIELSGQTFDRLLITVDDVDEVVSRLT